MSYDAREHAMVLVEEGLVSKDQMITMCLKYMSNDEVADMLDCNEFPHAWHTGEVQRRPAAAPLEDRSRVKLIDEAGRLVREPRLVSPGLAVHFHQSSLS